MKSYLLRYTAVSKQHVASLFWVEEQAKQEISKKPVPSKAYGLKKCGIISQKQKAPWKQSLSAPTGSIKEPRQTSKKLKNSDCFCLSRPIQIWEHRGREVAGVVSMHLTIRRARLKAGKKALRLMDAQTQQGFCPDKGSVQGLSWPNEKPTMRGKIRGFHDLQG
jgi:hypothetical protein